MRPIRMALWLFAFASCGGEIEEGFAVVEKAGAPAKLADAGEPAILPQGAWGTWQILFVDGDDHPPALEIELRENGDAFLWSCLGEANGLRCTTRIGCTVGKVEAMATTWRVRFTTDEGSPLGEGDVVDDPSGDIRVDGTGVLPKRARYRRVGAAGIWDCLR